MNAVSRGNAGAGVVLDGGGVVPESARVPLRELMDDRLLDALLERSRDQAGGLRLTGEGSMLGELVRAVLERALESELTAHLGSPRGIGGRGVLYAMHASFVGGGLAESALCRPGCYGSPR
jgi:hypothetical protein